MTEKVPKKIILYIDGGARGNPGPSALGAIFLNEKKEIIKKYSEYLGDELTNNQAEYEALIFSFKKIKALFGKKKIKNIELEVNSDSELLIKQMKGEYKIKEPKIQSLFLRAWNLKLDFKKVKFKLVPRQENKTADKLVNQALDNKDKEQKLL